MSPVRMSTGTWTWLVAVVICIAAGVAFWFGRPADVLGLSLPKHFGYYIAAAALVGGLAFGWRGAALPFAGFAAFGLAGLISEAISPTTGPGSGDVRGSYFLFFTYFPALFMAPALLGALIRSFLIR